MERRALRRHMRRIHGILSEARGSAIVRGRNVATARRVALVGFCTVSSALMWGEQGLYWSRPHTLTAEGWEFSLFAWAVPLMAVVLVPLAIEAEAHTLSSDRLLLAMALLSASVGLIAGPIPGTGAAFLFPFHRLEGRVNLAKQVRWVLFGCGLLLAGPSVPPAGLVLAATCLST